MKFKYATTPLLIAALSGCNVSSEDIKDIVSEINSPPPQPEVDSGNETIIPENGGEEVPLPPPPTPFNLTSITAKDSNTLTFTWSGDPDGITYRVCEKDVGLPNNCAVKATVVNKNSADVMDSNVFQASSEEFFILAENAGGKTLSSELVADKLVANSLIEYIKASKANGDDVHDENDYFGFAISLSGDGSTLAVGAIYESSSATGVNGSQLDNSSLKSGAVYVYRRSGANWVQEAYIKASNTDANDNFGSQVSLSDNGKALAVSASGESSNANGVNGNQFDNSSSKSGAVYVFRFDGSDWGQEAYIKASIGDSGDLFGRSISLSGDGSSLAVGALNESSSATGVHSGFYTAHFDNSAKMAGAVYMFRYNGSNWAQEAYIKASNTDASDYFGLPVSLNSNGSVLAVGAHGEDSAAKGVNGNQLDNSSSASGAAYVFRHDGSNWHQEAYIKASNTDASDLFSRSISLSGDGNTLAVSSSTEYSSSKGINGNQLNNSARKAGAVYVYRYDSSAWAQEAYIKASNAEEQDQFGQYVALSGDGNTLAVTAIGEDSDARGVSGEQFDNSSSGSGSAYLFRRDGGFWEQRAFIKASNTDSGDGFGYSASLSDDGGVLVIGAPYEDSGIAGEQLDNSQRSAGAAYIYD